MIFIPASKIQVLSGGKIGIFPYRNSSICNDIESYVVCFLVYLDTSMVLFSKFSSLFGNVTWHSSVLSFQLSSLSK